MKSILVLEDDEGRLEWLMDIVGDRGKITSTHHVATFLRHLDNDHATIDLVIFDHDLGLGLPTGADAVRGVVERCYDGAILTTAACIVWSANTGPADFMAQDLARCGFTTHLLPFSWRLEPLAACIRSILEQP